jgi:hypothetical protein
MKKESHWFSHDHNAASDPKLIALVAAYGMAGYGCWWRLLEILRGEDQYKYCITTKFAYSVLAKELLLNIEEARQFITDCIEEYQLICTDDEYIWSDSLLRRMEHLDNKRASYSERGKKGAQAKLKKTEALPVDETNIAEAVQQLPAANNNKPKETKENTTTDVDVALEDFKTKALADDMHFVYPLVSSGRVSQPQLSDWLSAFNRLLAFRGEQPKNAQDYRRHFINWFKFRDPAREDPHTFLLGNNKSPTAITTTFLKTPQQIEDEQNKQREEWKNKIAQ